MRNAVDIAVCLTMLAAPALAAAQEQTNECVPTRRQSCPTPVEIVSSQNAAARISPTIDAFAAARQIYAFQAGALYELYASPNFVSVILLEPGEAITAIAAGDTSRWMVTEAEAESEHEPRAIVLVKPQAVNLRTNIVIVTDRRTYLVEARAERGPGYSAEIAWSYPARASEVGTPDLTPMNSDYRIRTVRGRTPVWRPVHVFDDGRRTWIEFAGGVAASDLPPLFVITPEGAELVNYRVDGARYVIDRVFNRAELRLGVRAPIIVRIDRQSQTPTPARARRGGRP